MELKDWYPNLARFLARRRLIGLVAALLAAVCSLLLLFLLVRPKASNSRFGIV